MLDRHLIKNSLTITWAWTLGVFGVLLEVLPVLLDITGMPEVSEAIKSVLPTPWLGLYTAVIAILTYAARMRTLRQGAQ